MTRSEVKLYRKMQTKLKTLASNSTDADHVGSDAKGYELQKTVRFLSSQITDMTEFDLILISGY